MPRALNGDAQLATLTPSYSAVRCYADEACTIPTRTISVAALMARDLADPRDTEAFLPIEMPRKPKGRGKAISAFGRQIKQTALVTAAKKHAAVSTAETWPNFYAVRRAKANGRTWDY